MPRTAHTRDKPTRSNKSSTKCQIVACGRLLNPALFARFDAPARITKKPRRCIMCRNKHLLASVIDAADVGVNIEECLQRTGTLLDALVSLQKITDVNQNLEEICAALRAKQAMDLAREAVEIVAFEPGFVGLALEEIEKGLEEAADAAGGGDRDGDNVQGEGKELTFAVR